MENLKRTFIENSFKVTKGTTKSIEFAHVTSGEVIYLLPNQEITIVLDPQTTEANELVDRSFSLYHNTSLKQFPKRRNKGKEEIPYGYSFKFQSNDELSSFLKCL
ncbi:hypothetical protein LGQ02_19050 [Bacillus shivajii]|uniref:hypothetical protein n=1 Tax=Bacillus shivajii TaxID=1983719 RepID=UPI001CFC2E56|nr:hypothetical protein [Bacillus shivajii]UCZ52854.1 hypothetical protein LGQ02_19050 [Bacillus shivajii]